MYEPLLTHGQKLLRGKDPFEGIDGSKLFSFKGSRLEFPKMRERLQCTATTSAVYTLILGPWPARKWYRHSQWDPLDRLRPQEISLGHWHIPIYPDRTWDSRNMDPTCSRTQFHKETQKFHEIATWKFTVTDAARSLLLCPVAVSNARSPSGLSKILGSQLFPSDMHSTVALLGQITNKFISPKAHTSKKNSLALIWTHQKKNDN